MLIESRSGGAFVEYLLERLEAEDTIPQKTRRQRLKLHSLRVRSKFRQADYARAKLSELAPLSDHTETTAANEYEIAACVGFYCDSFWAFLYSSLDELAHVLLR